MAVKVLIVDDSVFFRNRLSQLLRADSRIQVVGSAKNGAEAVALAKQLRPDVITMDVEMPGMNGIEALRQIMREAPCRVMMLSSLTQRSAKITLEALESGAADYMAKDAKDWSVGIDKTGNQIVEKIVALGAKTSPALARRPVMPSSLYQRSHLETAPPSTSVRPTREAEHDDPARVNFPACRILVIGSSTGGPAALQAILPQLPAGFPMPILLVQHMPKTFTTVFAQRLDEICQIRVKEAQDGDRLLPGHAYLAPGGHQMILDPASKDRVNVFPSDDRVTYKPSVDVTFASVAKGYSRRTLAIVLTGMGSDGCEGARLLKRAGATVWAQSKNSCTIFGMPKAVIAAGLADSVLELADIGQLFKQRGQR